MQCYNKNKFIMKKILFSLVALLAVMTMQAQSICSSWHILQPVVETNADGSFTAHSYTYTFYEDGTYYLVDEVTLASEPSQTMALEVATAVELNGTYTLNGNNLTLTPNMNTYKTELISISRNGRVTNDSKVKANTNAKINGKDFKNKYANGKTYTVNIGDALLQMNDVNYARFATIKK